MWAGLCCRSAKWWSIIGPRAGEKKAHRAKTAAQAHRHVRLFLLASKQCIYYELYAIRNRKVHLSFFGGIVRGS